MRRRALLRPPGHRGCSLLAALLGVALIAPGSLPAQESDAPAATSTEIAEAIRAGDRDLVQGRTERAIAQWSRAEALLRQSGNRRERVEVLARRAEARERLGQFSGAIEDFTQALALAALLDDAQTAARLEGGLGRVHFLAGDPQASRKHLDACLAFATRRDAPGLRAAALNDLGNLLSADDPAAARETYATAAGLAADTGNAPLAVTARLNEARALLDAGSPSQAAAPLSQALASLDAQPPSLATASGLITAGTLLTRLSRVTTGDAAKDALAANRAFQGAAEMAREAGHARTLSQALGFRGALYENQERTGEALQLTRQALFKANEAGATDIAYRWQWQLGRLHAPQVDWQPAIAAYRQSVDTLQSLRREMLGAAWPVRRRLQEDAGQVFLELADLLLRRAKTSTEDSEVQSLLREARRTVELSKSVELENYFQDDCVAALQAKATSVDELSVQAAAVYPILLPDRVELLVSLPGRMLQVTSPAGKADVLASVAHFRKLLARRTMQYRRPAAELYRYLIAPIEAELDAANVETLVFVPAGALRTVPIAALHDGQRHLVEKYAVALTPGLTLFDPRPLSSREVQPLIGGVSAGVQGFSPLPHVASELEAVRSIVGGEVFADQGFVTASVQRALDQRPYTVVHLASHARFEANARDSFLLTYDGRMDMDELERFIKRSRFRDEPVELLTLSACATAVGDERAALGLAGVAIKAGARSALASLWLINDQASADLVTRFYRELSTGASKAKALQRAQVAMLEDRRYRYPVYWSPFLLIGNWL